MKLSAARLRRPVRAIALLGCCVVAASGSLLRAQPLADRMPSGALLYYGWAGADAAAENGFAGSHFQAVLAESRVKELFGSYLDQLERLIVTREPNAAEPFRVVRALGAPVWRYPSALVIERADDISGNDAPPIKVLLVTRAGGDSERLAGEWTALLEKIQSNDRPRAAATGDCVCVSFNYGDDAPTLPQGAAALAGDKAFTDAFATAKGVKSPMISAYLNVEGAITLIEEGIAQSEKSHEDATPAEDRPSAKVAAFLNASGLRAVKRYVGSAGFDGKDWVDTSFLQAPGPREGLLAAWPDGAVDRSLLAVVPADASFVTSGRFDAAVFVKQLQATLGKTDPDALRMFNQGLGMLQQAAGTNVLQNVLEPMGPDWVLYNAPHVGSASLLGTVAINKPDDPDKLRRALNAMSVSVANWGNVGLDRMNGVAQAQAQSGSGGIRAQQVKIGDANITYFTTPFLAPAWAIEDGRLYIGAYPQTVAAAVRQAKKGGPSIVDSEKHKALVARLGGENGSGAYYDLPAAAGYSQMYTTLLMFGRYAGIADLFGPPLPEPLLPPLDVLSDHLAPAGTARWNDQAGWHSKSVTPFPGANLLMEQGAFANAGPATIGLGTSIMLPALNRAREQANRVKSASNLRQIGIACMMYANANRGRLPENFGSIIKMQGANLALDVFVSPRSETAIPPEARTDKDAAAAFVDDHSDYVYLGSGHRMTEPNSAQRILAYESPEGVTDGINILWMDGHVEFVQMPRATELIEQAGK